jgi:hypothetical protein
MEPGEDLVAIVLLAPAVFLHDEQARGFHPLVGREAVLATETLPPPADGVVVVA